MGRGHTLGVLAFALIATVGVAVALYRETRTLRDDIAEQGRKLDRLEARPEPENPLAGLLEGTGSGADVSSLFGDAGGAGDVLSCVGGGGGGAPDLDKLLGAIGKPGSGKAPDLDKLLGAIGKPGSGKAPDLDKLLGSLGAPGAGGESRGATDPAQVVSRTIPRVERLRRLRFEQRPEVELLDDRAIRARVKELFLEDYPRGRADAEQRVLTALGAIPPGEDLTDLRLEALQGQVAGLYVPETGELIVRSSGSPGGIERITIAHELEHALADQRLDLPVPEEPDPEQSDADLAALAVVEGDATLTMQRFALQALDLSDLVGSGDLSTLLSAQQQLDELPHYLKQELTFPYLAGLSFVCERYQKGGWRAVDRAYARPPASTAQVLFPERYGEGEPEEPAALDQLEDPWSRSVETQIGAAQLSWLFEAPGGETSAALSDATRAAGAWGGGRLELWEDGERSAVGLSLRERSGEDGLCDSVAAWYEAAFPHADSEDPGGGERLAVDGDDQDAVLACEGEDVLMGIAPDLDTARAVIGS